MLSLLCRQFQRLRKHGASIIPVADELFDFCHPHFTTGLGIAVSAKNRASQWTLLRRVVSPRMLSIIGIMLGIIVACGLLFWLFERELNESVFGTRRRQGIGMGVWWSGGKWTDRST